VMPDDRTHHLHSAARVRLVDGLLRGTQPADLRRLSLAARFPLDGTFVVSVLTSKAGGALPDLQGLNRRHLVRSDPPSAVVVSASLDAHELTESLRRHRRAVRITMSWPVEPEAVPEAVAWVLRALDLTRRGVIAPSDVVDCSSHSTQLWLHADPRLRRRLCRELLQPLLAETPKSREVLSETLLAWLELRGSSAAIAARLGVHPQTVRYRRRRIDELFGADLRDPEFMMQAMMLLKASIPLWKAGDRTDFDRHA
jgi:DNA-binding CsgD family transcriptional regulator